MGNLPNSDSTASKDLLSLNQTIKTNMHVFDHTIKPIILYDCEVWGMFNPFISKFRNTLLNISRIFDKLPAENLHQKFIVPWLIGLDYFEYVIYRGIP
jgi:hypothetical protein